MEHGKFNQITEAGRKLLNDVKTSYLRTVAGNLEVEFAGISGLQSATVTFGERGKISSVRYTFEDGSSITVYAEK